MDHSGRDTATPDAKAIRDSLRVTMASSCSQPKSSLVIEELGVCGGHVRVDLAIVSDVLHGYEIKSDRDSLRRLQRQVEHYSNVFDRATLVVGDRHFSEAIDSLPSWWGVTLFFVNGGRILFRSIRDSGRNPDRLPRALVQFLWRDEVLFLLKERDLDKGVRSKSRRDLWDRMCTYFDIEEIAEAVRGRLLARTGVPVLPSPL